ncbi:MAG: hypothetical protein IPG61_17470 [bacterium]|nr:hypothetical protein [bacterium]
MGRFAERAAPPGRGGARVRWGVEARVRGLEFEEIYRLNATANDGRKE